jgi:hypothetical protein
MELHLQNVNEELNVLADKYEPVCSSEQVVLTLLVLPSIKHEILVHLYSLCRVVLYRICLMFLANNLVYNEMFSCFWS